MLLKGTIKNISILRFSYRTKSYLGLNLIGKKNKTCCAYITATRRNVFCNVVDLASSRVITSSSLKVPSYTNEFNERENLFKRGILLGELIGERLVNRGFNETVIRLSTEAHKGKKGVVRGLCKTSLQVSLIQLIKPLPHNGCRPIKLRRKKFRTKPSR